MLQLKVFTTKQDTSASLLYVPDILKNWKVETFLYEDVMKKEQIPLFTNSYIYLRDPFNAEISQTEIQPFLEAFINNNKELKYIDTISKVEDVYFEDKWRQYQIFSDYMPQTRLIFEQSGGEADSRVLYKKRISSRAKGISFDRPESHLQDYIAQQRLDIVEEYRVIEVCHTMLPDILLKSSRTEKQKVKVQKAISITEDLEEFVSQIQKHHTFDLVGYDIARTGDNTLYLLEVNRSPQLNGFVRETGVNPFRVLLEKVGQ